MTTTTSPLRAPTGATGHAGHVGHVGPVGAALAPRSAPVVVPRPLPWVLGGAAALVLLVLAAWLLVLAPQATAVQELRDQTAQAESTEALLTVRVAELKAQYADLPEYQAQLAALQQQVPTDAALPALVRSVRDAAAGTSVELTSLVPSAPVAVVTAATDAATTADAAAATDAGTTTDATATTTADGTTATTTATTTADGTTASGLVRVPVAITAKGTYATLQNFLASLQQQDRLLLVEGVGLAPSSAGAGGTGSTSALTLTLTGAVFALPAADTPTTTTSDAAVGASLS